MLAGPELDNSIEIEPNPIFRLIVDSDRVTYTYKAGSEAFSLTRRLSHSEEVMAVYKFSLRSDDYLFVRWGLDDVRLPCRFHATLFKAPRYREEAELQKIKNIASGCDP